ncbi:MAG: hypothetical protein A3K61_06635 [Thaumarchaeota archaeon RBG_16_49_8]|nr:MAG: hypothetical protein A3K61_06635 [Thaumarchaeota archaeon RBG_16_49_8]
MLSATASLMLASAVYAAGEPAVVPYAKMSKSVVDGVVTNGEYADSYADSATGMAVYWDQDGTNLHVALVSKGTGWVAIGFGPKGTAMDGANIIIGYVSDSGNLTISDEIGTGFEHYSDTAKGGSSNLLSAAGSHNGGGTTIEFVTPLNSGDVNDQAFQAGGSYGFILAYNKSEKDLTTYHTARSQRLSLQIEDPNATTVPGAGSNVTKPEAKQKATSLKLNLPLESMADGRVPISAKVVDQNGTAVSSSVVNFYVNTTFGEVKVGSAITNRDGTASINITRKIDGILAVRAEYLGDTGYNASGKVGYISVRAAHVTQSNQLWWVFDFTQIIIVTVIGSVFSVYAFVLYQVRKISSEGGAS